MRWHAPFGVTPASTHQPDPHRQAADNNTSSKRVVSKWSSDQPCTATIVQRCAPQEHNTCALFYFHVTVTPIFHKKEL